MASSYRVEEGRVFHDHHYKGESDLEAEAASFRVIEDVSVQALPGFDDCFGARSGPAFEWFAADRKSVWFMNLRVADADPLSFEGFIGGQCKWGRDRAHVWCFYVGARPKAKLMRAAQPESFGFFEERCSAYMREYARDAKRVYYYGRRVTGAQPGSFVSLPEDQFLSDSMQPRGIQRWIDPRSDYHRDAGHIWYKGRQVVDADVATFRCLEGGFGLDRSGFWDGLDPIGRMAGNPHFDLYVAARPELDEDYWRRIPAALGAST